jgi:hypothetical protein
MTHQEDKRLASIWLLITCLNAAKYALVELETKHMKQDRKVRFKALEQQIKSFLQYMPKDSLVHNQSFENVAAMTETMAMIAQLPATQIDWFLEQVNRLSFAAVNRELSTLEKL